MIVTERSLFELAGWVLSRYDGRSVAAYTPPSRRVHIIDGRGQFICSARIGSRIPIDKGTAWILERAKMVPAKR